MAVTMPVSAGWTTLVLPCGTIWPVAVATMSTLPMQAQAIATIATRMMVNPIARPTGEGGVSTISRAAGRNSRSSRVRRGKRSSFALVFSGAGCRASPAGTLGSGTGRRLRAALSCCIDHLARLDAMQQRVAPAAADQLFMLAVLDDAALLDGDDAVALPH